MIFNQCEECGKDFPASRESAKYCSDKCKQKAYRARKRKDKKDKKSIAPMELAQYLTSWQVRGFPQVAQVILDTHLKTGDLEFSVSLAEMMEHIYEL